MIELLGKNERLVFDGYTDLRAPCGEPLKNVPKYKIVNVRDANDETIEQLGADECLVLQGIEAKRDATGTFSTPVSLYCKVKKSEINPQTRLTKAEMDACNLLIPEMVEIFGRCMKEAKALDKQTEKRQEGET